MHYVLYAMELNDKASNDKIFVESDRFLNMMRLQDTNNFLFL